MPGGRLAIEDPELQPDYEEALRAYVAAHPESPDAGLQRALEAPPVAVAPGTRGTAPMAQPAAELTRMALGASMPRRVVGPTLTLGPGMSVGTYDNASPELTPEEKAAQGPLAQPPAPDLSEALGAAAAGVAPVAAQKNKGVPTVQVGHPADVQVPNTAVVRSALSAPLAPGEGRAPPQAAPPASPDPVQRALTAAALSAKPPQGDTDLEAALQAAAGRRLVAGLARAGGTMIGRGQGAAYDALDAEADRPIQEMQLRRSEAARQEEADPASSTSQTYRALLARMVPDLAAQPGWERRSAAQIKATFPVVEKMATLEATRGEKSAALQRQTSKDAAEQAHQKTMEGFERQRLGMERERINRESGAGGGKVLPASEAAKAGDFDAAQKSLDSLMETRKQKVGPVSGLAQYLPGTEAAQYTDAALSTAQVVGYILEGGKLSDQDLPRYLRMLPTAGDSEERARAKVANIKQLLEQKRSGQLGAMGAAGYNVGGLTRPSETGGPSVLEERTAPDGRTLQKMSDGSIRVKP